MIILEHDRLEFSFPEVHAEARCTLEFQRTLRIPDDDHDYPLPPGLGTFPLRHLDDYAPRLPEDWQRRGGVIAPMHQAEALWISFDSVYPFAVKVATGKICAISGDTWSNHLNLHPQDYVVLPDQPWLDGYSVENGIVRQFVAMPLGEGYTVEEQLTGAAVHGGLQIITFPMKAERFEAMQPVYEPDVLYSSQAMGLAPGGRMKQDIYDDEHGLDAWDQRHGSRCFVSLVNSAQWLAITGEKPPTKSPSAKTYTDHGLPWFEYYGGDARVVAGSHKLKGIKSVAAQVKQKGHESLPDNESIDISQIVSLGKRPVRMVRECNADVMLA